MYYHEAVHRIQGSLQFSYVDKPCIIFLLSFISSLNGNAKIKVSKLNLWHSLGSQTCTQVSCKNRLKTDVIAIPFQLSFRMCHYGGLGRPGGLKINCYISANIL